MLWTFVPVALLLSLTPGPGMALVVRNAAVGGTGAAFRTTVGSSIGVGVWAVLSAVGISALVAASETAFLALKVAGVAVLVWFGVQALRGRKRASAKPGPTRDQAFSSGLLTALANPKLAVFFVALLPQFLPQGAPVLPYALAMAAILVAADFSIYVSLGAAVSRTRRLVASSRFARRVEQATGAVLLVLAGRLALERS
ncbi:MAG TPA: LysE family translocator [Gaiellaceae bacterium]|nr:LysE family translocator [Gaiellaceae bacterium]